MDSRTLLRWYIASMLFAAFPAGLGIAEGNRSAAPIAPSERLLNRPSISESRCGVLKDTTGWWLVDPRGEPFFSLGICMFNQGTEKKDFDGAKPSYAAFRHYETGDMWANASLKRLKEWGFTTVGGWSDYDTVRRFDEGHWWLTPVLHLGSTSGAPWFDMWDKKIIGRIEEVADQKIDPLRGEARVLGYYSDNELGWWNAILWKMTLEQPSSSGQRQRLVRMIRDSYENSWDALLSDFDAQGASNWEDLDRGGMLWLRPGSNGMRTIRRFLALAADRYYRLMRDTIHRRDPEALYLGDRYQSFYYPEVAQASQKYVDVASTNLNASWNDGTFNHAYLETLHRLTGKPVIASELYMAAKENRSGNKNTVGGFPEVTTQEERAAALATTLRELARQPYVVGADWFQYYDEPPHGRKLDGEDYNFGLVDIHDRPYEALTNAFAAIDMEKLKSAPAPPTLNATSGIPRATMDPMKDFKLMRAIKHWDRRRGFVPSATEYPLGDLYVCWTPTALYMATFVMDIVEPDYYRDGRVPEQDRAKWSIRVNDFEPVTATIGAGRQPVVDGRAGRIKSLSGVYHNVRCLTAVELPATHFGKTAFEVGDAIALESSFTTHGRAYRMEWQADLVLVE